MRLHLIRHPKPDIPKGICYGQSDIPLQDATEPHAKRLKVLLPVHYTLYSSPLKRALHLAQALGSPQIDNRLQEMNFGAWERQPYENFSEQVNAWAKDPLGFRPPQGETGFEVAQRIWDFHKACLKEHLNQDVVVVGHSGPFRLWITQALGLRVEQQHVFCLDFAKLTQLELRAQGGRLCAMNL